LVTESFLFKENILLDEEGHVRLVDFGFAKKIAEKYIAFPCLSKLILIKTNLNV